jgi:hypothetical protein
VDWEPTHFPKIEDGGRCPGKVIALSRNSYTINAAFRGKGLCRITPDPRTDQSRPRPSRGTKFCRSRDHWTVFQNFLRAGEDGFSERDWPGGFPLHGESADSTREGPCAGTGQWARPGAPGEGATSPPHFQQEIPAGIHCLREFLSRWIRSACPLPERRAEPPSPPGAQ